MWNAGIAGPATLPTRSGLGSTVAKALLVAASTAMAGVTLVALLARQWWIAELFTHFRVQYAAAGLVLLIIALFMRRRLAAAVLGATVLVNAFFLAPYLPIGNSLEGSQASRPADGSSPAAVGANSLRVVSANVLYQNTVAAALIDTVRASNADVLAVLELTAAYAEQLTALHADYPYRVLSADEGAFGIGLYSRVPLENAEVVVLGQTRAVSATIFRDGGSVHFIGVHLLPPKNIAWADARNEQLSQLARLSTQYAGQTLVCGDFNLTPYSPYFQDFLNDSALVDRRTGTGFNWTWPTGFLALSLPIDHCLTDAATPVRAVETLGDIGSDHYPVLIDVEITTGKDG